MLNETPFEGYLREEKELTLRKMQRCADALTVRCKVRPPFYFREYGAIETLTSPHPYFHSPFTMIGEFRCAGRLGMLVYWWRTWYSPTFAHTGRERVQS